MLKPFEPSQDASMQEPSPRQPHLSTQEILSVGDISNGDQSESTGTEREGLDGEGYEVRPYELKENFGMGNGKIDEIFLSESGGGGAMDLSKQQEEDKEDKEQEQEEAQPQSNRKRSRDLTAANNPTSIAPCKKQRIINPPRRPTPHMLQYHTNRYRLYDATTQNQGAAVVGTFKQFGHFDDYALYINPNLLNTELEQIPYSGVRVDDLTASKVLSHYRRNILRTRWPAEFDQQGMIRATRVPLGRAAKRWVHRGERDVDEKPVEQAGWYYLSWGGIHTLMGKEGLDADRYWVRPSFESFKCPGLGFKITDWAEVQLAPEDPADPTFL